MMAVNVKSPPKLLGDSNRLRVSGVNALGPLEREIMDYMWTHESASVGDVVKFMRGQRKERAYTTIMTTMSKLAKKGLLSVDTGQVQYMYSPAMSRDEYMDGMISRVMDVLVDTDAEAVFAHLARRMGGRELAAI
jgi:predicted transcriptional regulator